MHPYAVPVKHFLDKRKRLAHTRGVTKPSPEVIAWLAEQGGKTKGKAVPGRARGGTEYYAAMARRRWEKARAKKPQPAIH